MRSKNRAEQKGSECPRVDSKIQNLFQKYSLEFEIGWVSFVCLIGINMQQKVWQNKPYVTCIFIKGLRKSNVLDR